MIESYNVERSGRGLFQNASPLFSVRNYGKTQKIPFMRVRFGQEIQTQDLPKPK